MTNPDPLRRRTLLAALAFGLAGCRGGDRPAGEPLRVAAASDLERALPALLAASTTAGRFDVAVTYGSSGALAEQIRQGAPFDLFLSANAAFVDRLAAAGAIVPASVRPYARGKLVLVVRTEVAAPIRSLADLDRPEIRRIAVANPDLAPYGAAARQALEEMGLKDKLAPKLVQAETVRQAMQYVATGNAEAGLVSKAVAADPAVRVVDLPLDAYAPLIQSLGIVARSRRKDDAEALARYLVSPAGQERFARLGFDRVAPGPVR